MKPGTSRGGFIAALLAGLLVVPGLAFAFGRGDGAEPDPAQPPEEVAATLAGSVLAVGEAGEADAYADLEAACGPLGQELVAAEASGDIDAVQQAALDALRPICEEAGSPLPPPPAAEPEVVYATAAATGPWRAAQTTNSTAAPVEPSIGEYPVQGGSVTLAFYPDEVEIVDSTANPGFEMEAGRQGAELVIEFRSPGHVSRIVVLLTGGEWSVTTQELPATTAGGDDRDHRDDEYDEDDHEDEREHEDEDHEDEDHEDDDHEDHEDHEDEGSDD